MVILQLRTAPVLGSLEGVRGGVTVTLQGP